MITKHTSGPLVSPHEGDPVQIGSTSGRFVAMALGCNETIATEEDYENARRLRACWNACDGIDTELLEDMGTGTFVRARDHAYEDRKLCDALLETLRSIAEYQGNFNSVEDGGAMLSRIEAKASAAINQVQSAVKHSGEFSGLQDIQRILGQIVSKAALSIGKSTNTDREASSDPGAMQSHVAHLPTTVTNMYHELRLIEIELSGWLEECPLQMNKEMVQRLLSVRAVLQQIA